MLEEKAANQLSPTEQTKESMEIEKRFTFEAAHRLVNPAWDEKTNRGVYGKCYNLHGHSYKLFIAVKGPITESGMVMNFTEIKRIIRQEIIDHLDHAYLNELPMFQGVITTVENIIQVIRQRLEAGWPYDHIPVSRITLWESETSYATWTNPELA
jgi:6-pyruvoyltetrahydropterin/6-carboxytetrahydropterin synthase